MTQSRYDELTPLAIEHSKAFKLHKDDCQRVLFKLVQGFAQYLGVPEGRMRYVSLDKELRFASPEEEVRYSHPEPKRWKDGFWYIGLQIVFGDNTKAGFWNTLRMLVGVGQCGDKFVIRSEKDFEIDSSRPETWEGFYQAEYESIRDNYSTSVNEPPRRIGFAPPGQDESRG